MPSAIALLAIGTVGIAWTVGLLAAIPRAPAVAAVANVLLLGAWAIAHTSGLPGGAPQPIGALDAFCAADSLAIALLAGGLALAPDRLARASSTPFLTQAAIVLAAASLAAVAAGHTHASAGGARAGRSDLASSAPHLYCRLL